MVVVSRATPSTAPKYFADEPLDSSWASTITAVDMMPDIRLTLTGVPKRDENDPRNRGPQPSNEATASARSAPMIQVVPLDSSAQMNIRAIRSPSTVPAPDSVTERVPSLAVVTLPPYTVNTVFIASMKPPSPDRAAAGRTKMMARIGTPYSRIEAIADRSTVNGTSR